LSGGLIPATLQPMRRLRPVAATLILTACAAAFPTSPMPAGIGPVPIADVAAWIASTRPARHVLLRFHWRFIQDGSSGGRGSVLIAPPDSLRLDFRGPLGCCSGAAAVVGDSALWAEPEDQVQKLVPSYPLLWAMVGVARPPRGGWELQGHHDATVTAWRYALGADTIDYIWVHTAISRLEAYVREGGKPIGRVVTVFDAEGHPVRSRLNVLVTPARLDINFEPATKQTPFSREAWLAPHDQ
jgi:hypothetical protein